MSPLLSALFLMAMAEVILADTTAQDGLWSENTTWVDSSPPTVLDHAYIADTHDIVVGSGGICSNFYLPSDSDETATLVVTNSACITNAGLTYVGYKGNGKLTIRSGTFESTAALGNHMIIGSSAGAVGEIEITGGLLKSYNSINTTMLLGHPAGSTGIVVQSGGVFEPSDSIIMGNAAGSKGVYNISGGVLNLLSRYIYVANGGYAELNLSGGAITSSTSIIIASNAGSTGIVNQTGGRWHAIGDLKTQAGSATYNLEGGELIVGDELFFSQTGYDADTIRISGGSLDINRMRATSTANGIFHVIGSGCTNINFQNTWDMYDPAVSTNNIVRAHVDGTEQGISLVKVGTDVDLENITLEIGITNGYSGTIGDTYEFIRIPEAGTITTNGWAVTNLDSSYQFKAYVTNYSSYDWVLIECTNAAPPCDGAVFRFR